MTGAADGTGDEAVAGKVVVVGPGLAGKSTLIQALCDGAINLEVRGRTVAMDHGMLRRGRRAVSLVGVPGQRRFSGVRRALVHGARAAVWVQRADEPPDPETASLLSALEVPYFVLLTHHGPGTGAPQWEAPPALPPPRAVIRGDLTAPDGPALARLEQELWKLLEEPASSLGG